MLIRCAVIFSCALALGCQTEIETRPPLEPKLESKVEVEPTLEPSLTKTKKKKTKNDALRVAPRKALGVPMPIDLLLRQRAFHAETYETEHSVDALVTFAKAHMSDYEITRFKTGSVRLTPPSEDGVEVLIIPLRSGLRRVSYRRLNLSLEELEVKAKSDPDFIKVDRSPAQGAGPELPDPPQAERPQLFFRDSLLGPPPGSEENY